ncbi:MAG TPA: hypothetical protein VGX23_23295 [Actinocrinis sp.]|nr:hypothetical protein [Actinocrinis sp.]
MPIERPLPKLNPLQISSLILLMAEARELTNTELKAIAGFTLTGTERTKLNELKYVESRKVGQTYAHQLTDQGWRACRDLWRVERPARSGPTGGALFALLTGLDRGLSRNRLSLAEFFAEQPAAPEPDEAFDPSGLPAAAQPAAAPASDDALDAAVRAAYRALAEEPGGWVGLAPLRAELARTGHRDRARVDEALVRLAVSPDAHLIPVANSKSLTEADRDAALPLGGEDNHALSIEGR